jgi:SAM-dependent methyltransferase
MDVERSYFVASRSFNTWVRLMEYQTREMEVVESARLGPRRLIISSPTDAGIPLLAHANAPNETRLLCFSNRLERLAKDYCRRHSVDTLTTCVEPFFVIPAPDESLSAIYANCLFDFCAVETFDSMFREIWRVLEPGGLLFAVHMSPPIRLGGRLWKRAFTALSLVSDGCQPVSITAHLTRTGFVVLKDLSITKLGFPTRYSVSEKPNPSRAATH